MGYTGTMTRREGIEKALEKLEQFKSDPAYTDKRYAIDANIEFLRATRSFPQYVWWLVATAPKLDGAKLLELTDFPVEEWDIAMHTRLIEMERQPRPGLITPLVNAITRYIDVQKRDLVIANFGAGGMEVDRQVAQWAIGRAHPFKVTIVAVDNSPITRKIARKNLESLGADVAIVETGKVTEKDIAELRAKTPQKVLIVMCTNDIFDLESSFSPAYFDVVYHSLFRHHLAPHQQKRLDEVIVALSKRHFEFDGFKYWPVVIAQTIVGWSNPNFLNGEIFSNLRFHSKRDRVAYARPRGTITFFAITGFYLLEYR